MTQRPLVFLTLALLTATAGSADVSLVERKSLSHGKALAHDFPAKAKPDHAHRGASQKATGSQALIDSSGVKYFINTAITFSTSSSASGAMSEASYTAAVNATTLNGGTTSSTLNDAFDGYNAICIGTNGTAQGPCESGSLGGGGVAARPTKRGLPTKGSLPDYMMYTQTGPATTECNGRQVVLPVQTIDLVTSTIQVSRKVFVPSNDSFGR